MATRIGTLSVIEPATERVLAELQEATVEDDALRIANDIANDTIYGLSGSIWTNSAPRAMRMARGLESGTGPHALEHYTELKNVFLSTS